MLASEAPTPESVDQLSKRLFSELHHSIVIHENGARTGQAEAVHDMRVAIRRLRVALGNFAVCLSRDDRKRLRARLENLARALGGVRDLDVMIAALDAALPGRSANTQHAIAALTRRLMRRRRQRLRELVIYLDGGEYAAFKIEFSETAEPAGEWRVHGQAA